MALELIPKLFIDSIQVTLGVIGVLLIAWIILALTTLVAAMIYEGVRYVRTH